MTGARRLFDRESEEERDARGFAGFESFDVKEVAGLGLGGRSPTGLLTGIFMGPAGF